MLCVHNCFGSVLTLGGLPSMEFPGVLPMQASGESRRDAAPGELPLLPQTPELYYGFWMFMPSLPCQLASRAPSNPVDAA